MRRPYFSQLLMSSCSWIWHQQRSRPICYCWSASD